MHYHLAALCLLLGVHGAAAFAPRLPKTSCRYGRPFPLTPVAPLPCGILAICDSSLPPAELRLKTLMLQRLVRHRGPDGSGIHVRHDASSDAPGDSPSTSTATSVAHERLAIVDPLSGNQPLYSHDRNLVCTVNGEIYNHEALRSELQGSARVPRAATVRLSCTCSPKLARTPPRNSTATSRSSLWMKGRVGYTQRAIASASTACTSAGAATAASGLVPK